MAKFLPGPTVGRISGRIGASIFSHNKGGPYIRNGTKPTISTTEYAQAAKSRLAGLSASWEDESAADRLAWKVWAETNPITDRLGQSINLTGHQAYISLNARLLASSLSAISAPPVDADPPPLYTLTVAVDIGPGDTEIVFTPSPIGASDHVVVRACVLDSPAIHHVSNMLRLVGTSAAEQESPLDIESMLTGRFGSLAVGQVVVVQVHVLRATTGLVSPPLRAQTTVVDTTV